MLIFSQRAATVVPALDNADATIVQACPPISARPALPPATGVTEVLTLACVVTLLSKRIAVARVRKTLCCADPVDADLVLCAVQATLLRMQSAACHEATRPQVTCPSCFKIAIMRCSIRSQAVVRSSRYYFKYPTGWKTDVINKVQKGTQVRMTADVCADHYLQLKLI